MMRSAKFPPAKFLPYLLFRHKSAVVQKRRKKALQKDQDIL